MFAPQGMTDIDRVKLDYIYLKNLLNFVLTISTKDVSNMSSLDKEDACFKKIPALNNFDNYYSYESRNNPGYYITISGDKLILTKYADTDLFKNSASFIESPASKYT